MANILDREKQISVVHHLAEGNSIRATSRLCRVHRNTVMNLLADFGPSCGHFMDLAFGNLRLDHIQIDEIWTFVGKKQGQLTDEERADDPTIGDIYLFTALDEETKLVPAFVLGKRTKANACELADTLAERIVWRPGGQDEIQISTDGFPGYPDAINSAFGESAKHGVLVKQYENPESGRYAPPRLAGTDRREIQNIEDLTTICTSHVERHNLTIRTFMRRFTRLALGFSKKLENLEAAVQLFLAYYNFCWRPRENGNSGRLRPSPAVMAGITDHVWSIDDLFDNVMGLEQDRIAFERYAKLRSRLFGDG
ncbi:MAG: hypothetical protein IID45_11895 [Planctomycetes bacterium]|nr:hypothetical protein [Planctomycetota bacterium]